MGGVDLATLGIKVDSTDAKGAASDLDKLTAAGARTEKATDSLGAAHRKSAGEVKSATAAAEQLTQRWTGMAGAIGVLGSALAALGLASMVQQIVETNKEFQSLQASLKISAGSAEAATAAFDEIKKFASETPFALDQSVKAFIKLKNLGLDPSTEAMRSYGNTAASMGKDLNDMIEAVADASTGEFERLKEFGIKAAVEGNKVAFTFQGVTTSIGNNSKEIQTYLRNIGDVQFAGAMAEQMNTLSGQAANLGDALESAFVAFGEGGFNAALSEVLQSMTGAAAGAEGLAGQLGALAGDAVRMAADFVKTVAPAFRFVAENLGTIFKLGTSAAIGIGALRAVMVVGGIVQYASAAVGLAASLGGVSAASVIATAATTAMAAAARGLLLALGPIGIALTAAAIAYEYLSDNADGAANSTETARETLNRLKKEANETAPATNALGGALQMAQSEMLTAAEKARALITQLYGVKFAALQAAAALAQADVMKAWSKVNRANESDLRSPFAVMMGVDFGRTRADAAEYKRAVGELSAANRVAQIAEDAVANAHSNAAAEAKKMMDAANAAAPKVEKLGASHEKAGKAAKAAKAPVDELAKSYESLQRSVNDVERSISSGFSEKLDTYFGSKKSAEIKTAAQETDELVASIEKLSDDKYRAASQQRQEALLAEEEAARQLNRQMQDLARAFDQIGGIGGTLGDVVAAFAGLQSGDFSGVRGSVGGILTMLNTTGTGKEFLGGFRSTLDEFFGGAGKFTEALGAFGLAVSANQMIGDVLGFKGGPLGIFTSLFESLAPAKKGRATFSGALDYNLTGNSTKREDAVGDLAGAITDVLKKFADALGATVSGFTGTVSLRDNNLRYDPSGQGITKTSKGAMDFGQDEAALIQAVLRDAISDGVFGGLSDGVSRLLKSGTDIEAQLQKALSFQAVFSELAKMKDPTGAALQDLENQFNQLKAIFAEAGASTADYAALEELYALKRADLSKQETAVTEDNRKRRELEIQIMQLEGDASGALAAARALELAELDAALRPLQERIYVLQDEAEATAKAAKTAAELAAIAKQSRSLDIQLMEALGNASGALAAKRADELTALDESLRGKQAEVWAAQDAAQAAKELAAATEAATRASEALANQRRNLEITVMELLGDASGALAARRADELAALDPSLRALQERINALQDMKTAEEAAAAASQALAEAQAEAARMAEEAAQKAKAISEERFGLEIRLLEATGQGVQALALRRAAERAAMDESNRALADLVWAAEDAANAIGGVSNALELAKQAADLNIRLLEAQGNSSAALAARRAQELAATDETLRATLQAIYAAEDAATAQAAQAEATRAAQAAASEAARAQQQAAEEAARYAAQVADTRSRLEIELMRALGNEAGAVAAQRQLELDAMDSSLRALQRQVWAEQDAATARDAAAKAIEEANAEAERRAQAAADLARTRRGLEIEIMELTGNAAGALAARRADELAAMDPTLRALQNQIYALTDAADAAERLADAQAEATRIAEEAAAKVIEIEKGRTSLTIALLEAQGNSSAALALRRAEELAATDPLLRALQEQVWATQDAASAAADLAKAQEEAAAKAEQLAKDRMSLEIQLLELQGNTAQATALRRQLELEAMDESLRPLQMLIYAYQDAQVAEEAHAQAVANAADLVEKARSTLTDAYEREAGALKETIARFTDFGDSLRAFREGLFATDAATASAYRTAQVKFITTSALAATGNEAALGGLEGVSKTFLDASRANASSLVQYQRDVAAVARSVDAAIGAADEAVDYAQLELDALNAQVVGILDLNKNFVTFADALQAYLDAQADAATIQDQTPQPPSPVQAPSVQAEQTQAVLASNAELRTEVAGLRADLNAALDQIAINTRTSADVLKDADRNGALCVVTDSDTPISVEVMP